MSKLYRVLVAAICFAVLGTNSEASVTLVKKSQPRAVIVVPNAADKWEKVAAERFQYYIRQISGADLKIVPEAKCGNGTRVFIGHTSSSKNVINQLQKKGSQEESSIILAKGNNVYIAGFDDAGTMHATYFLLEQLGCRWYFPADWGFVIPKSATVSIADQDTYNVPSFKIRAGLPVVSADMDKDNSWALKEWGRGNHLGGWTWWGAGHSYDYLVGPDNYEKHPDWFAYYNNKRNTSQLCTTNPEVREQTIESLKRYFAACYDGKQPKLWCISPNDNNDFCQCFYCSKLTPNLPNGSGKNWSNSIDRIVDFANNAAEWMKTAHPDCYVTYYCNYHSEGVPTLVKPASNTVFWLTHWGDDQFQGVNDNSRLGHAICEWSKFGNPLFIYTYWGSYGSYTFWPAVHAIENDVRYFKNHGAIGVYSETHQNWGGEHLNFIVYPRLLWNVNTDVPAYIDDFCSKFYGPAAKPMREYYNLMETAAKNGPPMYHEIQMLTQIFNSDLLAKMRSCIDQANQAVAKSDPVYRKRMQFVSDGFRLGELYFGSQNLIRTYPRTKDPTIRTRATQMMREALNLIERPEYKYRLTNNELPAEPIISKNIADLEQGTTFKPGKFTYSDWLSMGGRTFIDTVYRTGFIDGRWGLDLDGNSTGELVYEMKTTKGRFKSFSVDKLPVDSSSVAWIETSDSANGPWQICYTNSDSDDGSKKTLDMPKDVTSYAHGKDKFYLRIRMFNKSNNYAGVTYTVGFSGEVVE